MAIIYIAAEAAELTPFATRLTGLRPLKWPLKYAQEGILDGRRILLASNGAGPKLAVSMPGNRHSSYSRRRSPIVPPGGGFEHRPMRRPRTGSRRRADIGCHRIAQFLPPTKSFPRFRSKRISPYTSGAIVSQDRIAVTPGEKIPIAGTLRRDSRRNGGFWSSSARKTRRITVLLHQSRIGSRG